MDNTFVTEMTDIKELKRLITTSSKPVLVDFWAEWCPPCQYMRPIFHEIAEEFSGQAVFVSVNTDEAQELAQHFGIKSIPTFLGFKNREKEFEIIGSQPATIFRNVVLVFLS